MKILYYSNPPYCNSGYGRCCRWISSILKDAGHEIGIAPNVAFGPGALDIGGMPIHAQGTGFSEAPTIEHYLRHKYDVLLTQYDLWALDTLFKLVQDHHVNLVPYIPLDHDVMLPKLKEKLQHALYLVAMCDYGLKQLRNAGFENSTRIYHGVDTSIFKPLLSDKISKIQLHKHLGFEPDSFVIGIVKMNKGLRSALPRQLQMIRQFIDQNPDIKTRIYLHTEMNAANGYNLSMVLEMLGLAKITRVANNYTYFSGGYSDIAMAKMYNACDVTMACTYSEGFGMPVIESLACGTPVVAGDYTSMSELLNPVTPELLVEPVTKVWQQVPAQYFLADIDKGVQGLETVLNTDPSNYHEKLSEYAKKTFDWADVIAPQWIKFFNDTLPRYIAENCLKVPDSSEILKKQAAPLEIKQ